MKCELCHKAKASTVLKRKNAAGEEEELYVCGACAKSGGNAKAKKEEKAVKDLAPFLFKDDKDKAEPPPFVKNLVDATLGFMKGVVGDAEKAVKECPKCGCKWETIKMNRQLGCPECWRHFADLIRCEFLRSEFGLVHKGDISPQLRVKNTSKDDLRRRLERELKAAVKCQAFERAAEIRRRLDKLAASSKGPKS